MPVEATAKFAACPADTVTLAGCCVITGAVAAGVDVLEPEPPPPHAVKIVVRVSSIASANAAPPDCMVFCR